MIALDIPRYFTRKSVNLTGIYFLFRKGRLIYIGQTTNLHSRLSSHVQKKYDYVRFIECDESQLNEYETRWINRFYIHGKFSELKVVREKSKVFIERIS